MAEKKIVKPAVAVIDGNEYTVNSDNAGLLEALTVQQYNKETKKMEDVSYPYLPIDTVYSLLEQLYPDYSVSVYPMEIEKTQIIKKSYYDKFKKTNVETEQEVSICKTHVTLTIGDRTIEGNARGVATTSQIAIDQMVNGLNQRMEARALKNACKKLGKVFRIKNDEEDVLEKEQIAKDATVNNVEKVNSIVKDMPNINPSKDDLIEAKIKELYETGISDLGSETPTVEALKNIGVTIRDIMDFKKGDEADVILRKVFNEYKTKFNLK